MKHTLLVLIILSLWINTYAQRWKQERKSAIAGIGTNNFMGDLGGGKKNAAHFFGVRDLDFVTTRPTFQFGYRYRITEIFAVKGYLTYARIAAKDAASGSEGRRLRNLEFRSNIWELSGQFEYYFIKEKELPRYTFSSLMSARNFAAYVFIGFGTFYYNPKAEYNGKWYALQPLATEGQGLNHTYTIDFEGPELKTLTTPDKYKRVAVSFPFGLGAKYNINKSIGISIEISNRYTSTDYLDDASDRYFNYTEQGITPANAKSLVFTDRHLDKDPDGNIIDGVPFRSGQLRRGNPKYNDAMIFTVISVHYRLPQFFLSGKPKYY